MVVNQREFLTQWYLARLRRLAHEQVNEQITPAALVKADSALVREAVLSAHIQKGSDIRWQQLNATETRVHRYGIIGLLVAFICSLIFLLLS